MRDNNIDAIRFVGFCAIALLHSVSYDLEPAGLYAVINHATRWAVPVFFMISGYVFELGRRGNWEKWRKTALRLSVVFVSWELIYHFVYAAMIGRRVGFSILDLLMSGGVAWHLWFLPSLGLCLTIHVLLRGLGWKALLSIALLFFTLGVLLGPYSHLAGLSHLIEMAGQPDGTINTRGGPFFGLIFVVMGAYLASHPVDHRRAWWLLAFLGFLVQILEAQLLAVATGVDFAGYDYLFGTLVFGLGAFMAMRQVAFGPMLGRLGRISLGMYCCHVLVRDIAFLVIAPQDPSAMGLTEVLSLWAAVVVLSTVLTALLDKLPFARKIVR